MFIKDAFGKDIDDSGVANMPVIESQWTDDAPCMVSHLKEVYVYYDDVEIDVRVQERLEHCCQEGLILSLDYLACQGLRKPIIVWEHCVCQIVSKHMPLDW